MTKFTKLAGAAAIAGMALTGAARAADEAPAFAWSMTATGTSDYIFRGISQTAEDPAFQLSFDGTYGIFYAGVWGSNIDLDVPGNFGSGEIDFYAGIKPVFGPVTLDLGVLYYYYPGSNDPGGFEADYVELKLGASATPFENASVAANYYYTPDNFGEVGTGHTIEGSAGYTFAAIGMFTPSINGTVGYVIGDDGDTEFLGFGDAAEDNYTYWNAGLALAVEKFTFDFRYHDTDIGGDAFCNGVVLQCDTRFVFSAKVTLP